jgi:heat shock protein HslJ
MNEDPDNAVRETGNASTEEAAPVPPQPLGLKLIIALALVGFLVLLIIYADISGTRASAGIRMTKDNWTLESYGDTTGTLVQVQPGTQITAVFRLDGRLSGSAGCNRYSANYTVRDLAITISPPISTTIVCDDPRIMQQESAYINNLQRTAVLRINESSLKLFDESGKPVLVFVKG